MYLQGKIFTGTSSILAQGKSRVLPTDPLFTLQIALTRIRDKRRVKKSREKFEKLRFQLIDISTVWQPKSNDLKRTESGRKKVVK